MTPSHLPAPALESNFRPPVDNPPSSQSVDTVTVSSGRAPRRSGPAHRARTSGPKISVILVSTQSRSALGVRLAALVPQCARAGVELIVVRSASPSELAEWRRVIPTARWVGAHPGASMAELRGIGMAESTGDIVGITEDDRQQDERWVEALRTRGITSA